MKRMVKENTTLSEFLKSETMRAIFHTYRYNYAVSYDAKKKQVTLYY